VIGASVAGTVTAGTLLHAGNQAVGFDQLIIGTQGEMVHSGVGSLQDVKYDAPPPFAPWTPFVVENHGKVEILSQGTLGLFGGIYRQLATVSVESPITILWTETGLFTMRFATATFTPDYSIDVLAGKVVAYETATIGAKTDIRIKDATIEFYNPGVFERGGIAGQLSTLGFTAKEEMAVKNVLIENTPIKFLDWNPVGRYTNTTQVNAKLNVDGKLELAGTTELHSRVNVLGRSADSVSVINPSGLVKLSGNQLKLKLRLKNLPDLPGMYGIPGLLSGPAMDAPATPFGGGTTLVDPPAGYSVSAAARMGTMILVTVTKAP
jgi:hypothetical protein